MLTILPSRSLTFRTEMYRKAFRRDTPFKNQELSLGLIVLSSLTTHKATKAIDKVYCVYHILELMHIRIPELDYNKSALEAYEETTGSWIRSRESLAILLIAARPSGNGEEPSWVPDGNQDQPSSKPLWFDPIGTRHLLENSSSTRPYHASKKSKAHLQEDDSMAIPGRLLVLGQDVGQDNIWSNSQRCLKRCAHCVG